MTSTDSANTSTASHDKKSSGGLLRFVGVLGIIGGILMMVAGVTVWVAVSNQLAAEQITVADDAAFLAGMPVADPFTAYAEADIINHHALEASDGKTYAELDREDPVRVTVMTASFLRASLFTSIVSFGVAAFAMGTGLLFVLFGWAVFALAPRSSRDTA
jgi:predicted cobalt transporter CbtA